MNLDADSPGHEDGDVAQPVATGEDGLPEQAAEKGKRRAAKSSKKPRTLFGTVVEILVIVAAAFAIAMLVQLFLIKPFTIHQVSMQPTLMEGDRILLNRVVYHFREPKSGDIVVFESPVNRKEDLVKRVVAVAGDRVAIRDGKLYVNGVPQEEPYLREENFRGELPEATIPPGEVFVLGDNRNNSGDSRLFGPISTDSIMGEAFFIYWPIGRWRGV